MSITKSKHGYKLDKQIFDTQADAELAQLKARVQMELHKAEIDQELLFRKDIGLTLMESDAKMLHQKLVEAAIELAYVVEMDKNDYVTDKAKRKVVNTRIMYNEVCKRIFKVCLQHGVKSEHTKSG